MNEKEYKQMSEYKMYSTGENSPFEKKPRKTFYNTYINNDAIKEKRKELESQKGKKEKGEPKSAIWWMIMMFCIVYGFEYFYNALIQASA